jgi:hypothetical protein
VVNNFLQDLMEWEVVDSVIVQDLALDSEERDRMKRSGMGLTLEACQRQVQNQIDIKQNWAVSKFPTKFKLH